MKWLLRHKIIASVVVFVTVAITLVVIAFMPDSPTVKASGTISLSVSNSSKDNSIKPGWRGPNINPNISSTTVYSPSSQTGGWTNPTYAYSSDNQYATRAPSYLETRSPTTASANWTDPTNADADGGGYAYITAANPSASSVWGSYGFSLSGYTIDQVRVRYDAWSAGFSSNGTYAYKLPVIK